MDRTLLKTIHGSHLYGLNHSLSDQDFYTVVSRETRGARKKYAKQSIVDGIDSMTVDLSTFIHMCDEGVPQALEAMFSPFAETDMIKDFRRGYRVDTAKATRTYRRTIASFAAQPEFKARRHAVRLCMDMAEFQAEARFNPRMSSSHIALANLMAGWPDKTFQKFITTRLGGTGESAVLHDVQS